MRTACRFAIIPLLLAAVPQASAHQPAGDTIIVRGTRLDPDQPPAFKHGLKPADGGFDFGKLGHRPRVWRRPAKPARGRRQWTR